MKIHIGKIISKTLAERGMNKSEFARRINKTRQNVDDILLRESLDTNLMLSVSNVLEHDLFQYYAGQLKFKKNSSISKDLSGIKVNLELQQENEDLKKEVAYLKEITDLLKEKSKKK